MTELGVATGPARRPEVRSDATRIAIDALFAAASGTARTWAAGAVEIAAGQWERALSVATVEPAGLPVGAAWLSEVGRDLARHGEAVYLADVTLAGRLRLLRATVTDVWGDSPDPADWWYSLTITGPRSVRTTTAPAASVVHVRYATQSYSPARGLSPLEYANLSGALAANLEQALGHEAGGAVARLITLPHGFNAQELPADGSDPNTPLPADTLAESIRTAKGRTLFPETTRDSYGDKGAAPPKRDFEPARLGADPPMAMVQLRRDVECSVLGIFGVPAPLGPAGLNDGTAHREALRRLWSTTIQPLANRIAEELSRVLERPVTLSLGPAGGATDAATRARAVKALTEAGESLEDAKRRVGWD